MRKPTIIVHSPELPDCPLVKKIFGHKFRIHTAKMAEDFIERAHALPADAAVICFCSSLEDDLVLLERLKVSSGALPVLTCSKRLEPEFIRKASLRGVERFLLCDMEPEKIYDLVRDAIRDSELKAYLESCRSGSDNYSPYVRKFIEEIVHVYPLRITITEFAHRLRIDRGWLTKICKQVFNKTPTALLRHVWVHQALRMMLHTNLNNTEISVQLNYSNASSMAREFRKELGYCPRQARKRLLTNTPEELLSLSR